MQAAAIWAYIENFSAHLARPQPLTLFHYSPADSALGIVQTGELWASAFQYLRGASEPKRSLGVALYLVQNRLNELSSPALSSERVRRSLCDTPSTRRAVFEAEVLKQVAARLGPYLNAQLSSTVVTFSAKADDPEQWQRCCPQGGYALGFAADKLALVAAAEGRSLLPCYYGGWEDHDEIIQGALLGSMQAWVARVEEVYASVPNLRRAWEQCKGIVSQEAAGVSATLLQVALLLRHETHRHEEEWRLLGEEVAATKLEYRERRGLIIPYQAVALTPDLAGTLPLTRVLVGTRGKRDLAQQGLRGLLGKYTPRGASEPSVSPSRTEWQAPGGNEAQARDTQGYTGIAAP